MVYGSLSIVKQRLGITTNTHDTQATQNLADANDWVDNELKPHVSVPLSPAPDEVISAENDIAAGMFEEERFQRTSKGDTQKSFLKKRGEEKLKDYIETTYKPGQASRQTTGFTKVTSGNSWDP